MLLPAQRRHVPAHAQVGERGDTKSARRRPVGALLWQWQLHRRLGLQFSKLLGHRNLQAFGGGRKGQHRNERRDQRRGGSDVQRGVHRSVPRRDDGQGCGHDRVQFHDRAGGSAQGRPGSGYREARLRIRQHRVRVLQSPYLEEELRSHFENAHHPARCNVRPVSVHRAHRVWCVSREESAGGPRRGRFARTLTGGHLLRQRKEGCGMRIRFVGLGPKTTTSAPSPCLHVAGEVGSKHVPNLCVLRFASLARRSPGKDQREDPSTQRPGRDRWEGASGSFFHPDHSCPLALRIRLHGQVLELVLVRLHELMGLFRQDAGHADPASGHDPSGQLPSVFQEGR
mmetsp:Transcript_4244/g.15046  ORF Transcript_4244/g.15046 Transcript_4244/m.15046 type:complete len:341 (+) Transcript_4244:658-1680(+)